MQNKIFKNIYLYLGVYLLLLNVIPCSDVCGSGKNFIPQISPVTEEHSHHQDLCTPFCWCACCNSNASGISQSTNNTLSNTSKNINTLVEPIFSIPLNDHWKPPRGNFKF